MAVALADDAVQFPDLPVAFASDAVQFLDLAVAFAGDAVQFLDLPVAFAGATVQFLDLAVAFAGSLVQFLDLPDAFCQCHLVRNHDAAEGRRGFVKSQPDLVQSRFVRFLRCSLCPPVENFEAGSNPMRQFQIGKEGLILAMIMAQFRRQELINFQLHLDTRAPGPGDI